MSDLKFQGKVMKQCTQLLGVGLSFMFGLYCMHILYNIVSSHMGWYYHLLFLFPLVCDMVLLLPLIILEQTVVQTFCDPSVAVMQSVCDQMSEAWNDLVSAKLQITEAAKEAG